MGSTVNQRIRELFETARRPDGKAWTLQEVAKHTGLSVSYIWRLRSGRAHNPTRLVLERLASFFGVPVSYFMADGGPVSQAQATASQNGSPVHQLLDAATKLYRSDRLDDAESLARRAVQDAQTARDPVALGKGLAVLAQILASKGETQRALDAATEALRRLGGPKAGPAWSRAVLTLAYVESTRERVGRAYNFAREALVAMRPDGADDELWAHALYRLGSLARRLGRTDEAVFYLEHALSIAENLGGKILASTLLSLGLAYLDAGQPERALSCFARALSTYSQARVPYGAAKAQHNMGLAYAKLGRWQEAIESLTKSLGSNEALGDLLLNLYDHMELGCCYASVGQREPALRHAYAALALAQEHDWAAGRARAHWHLGRVHALLGDDEEAAGHYERAVHMLEELGLDGELAKAELEFGDLLAKRGDHEQAARHFRKAAATLMHMPSLHRPRPEAEPPAQEELELAAGKDH